MRTRLSAALFLALTLTLYGCNEEDLGDPGDSVEDRQAAPEEVDTPLSADVEATETEGGITVVVEALSFPDQFVTVTAGQPVTFDNRDSVAHTVTAGTPDDSQDDAAGAFDTDLPAGGEVTITVDDPGTYPFFCEIHQGSTGRLVVRPAS